MSDAISVVPHLFENSNLSTVIIDGKPWWIAREVAVALGYGDPKQITRQVRSAWADELDPEDTLLLQGDLLRGLKEVTSVVTFLHQASLW